MKKNRQYLATNHKLSFQSCSCQFLAWNNAVLWFMPE